MENDFRKVLSSDEPPEEVADTETTEELEELFEYIKKKEREKEYQDFFSHFSNLPKTTQTTIILNICIIIASLCAFGYCVFGIKYFRWELFLVIIVLNIFLIVRTIAIKSAFSNLDFVLFTGEIVEAYEHGTKIMKDRHFILRLQSDEGKDLCVRYFDSKSLHIGQRLSVFMRPNTSIEPSEYGPIVEEYIVIVPTEDIVSRFKLESMKEESSDELSIEQYLNK